MNPTEEQQAKIASLRTKYPKHFVGFTKSGKIGRWCRVRYYIGQRRNRTPVYRERLLAVYE